MLTVVYEPWRMHPLAWIHRGEARAIAAELNAAGYSAVLDRLDRAQGRGAVGCPMLLRVSDPVMLRVTRTFTDRGIRYLGPSTTVIARCYDKLEATSIARAAGVDCPDTALAPDATSIAAPRILKPRRGSDSIGVRALGARPVPARFRSSEYLVQHQVRGMELTVAVLAGRVGLPVHIELPEDTPYSFLRKYVVRPPRRCVHDQNLVDRCRALAARAAAVLGVDWATRVDMIYDRGRGRLCFLECDVAPIVSAESAFAVSLTFGGVSRDEQLRLLLQEPNQ